MNTKEKIDRLFGLNYCILDTETTGLDKGSEVIELSIIDKNDSIIFDEKFKPIGNIPDDAVAVHGITDEMLRDCKAFSIYYEEILRVLKRYEVIIIYNSAYDVRLLDQTAALYDLESVFGNDYNTACLMKLYAEYWGEWREEKNDFKNQSLANACRQQGVDISDLKTHRALNDCIATNRLLVTLVNRK